MFELLTWINVLNYVILYLSCWIEVNERFEIHISSNQIKCESCKVNVSFHGPWKAVAPDTNQNWTLTEYLASNLWNNVITYSDLKFVHFKKIVAQSSFLSKVLSFLLKTKQNQRKSQHFWKKWGLCNCLLKMNGL